VSIYYATIAHSERRFAGFGDRRWPHLHFCPIADNGDSFVGWSLVNAWLLRPEATLPVARPARSRCSEADWCPWVSAELRARTALVVAAMPVV
jgi:hypothetical protein